MQTPARTGPQLPSKYIILTLTSKSEKTQVSPKKTQVRLKKTQVEIEKTQFSAFWLLIQIQKSGQK